MLQKVFGAVALFVVLVLGDTAGLSGARNVTVTSNATLTSNVSSTENIVQITDATPTTGKDLTYMFQTVLSVLSSYLDIRHAFFTSPFKTFLGRFLPDRIDRNHARDFHHTN